MSDISKRLEKAEKHLQKGKHAAALEEYMAALEEEPGNDLVRQRAADLCLTLNQERQAAILLGELFDRQAGSGSSEAAATYKKLARIMPVSTDRTLKVAHILERSNRREAVETYLSLLKGYVAQGNKQEALNVLRRIVALEPSEDNFRREAELAVSLGDSKGAAQSFFRASQLAQTAGRPTETLRMRAYSLDPQNPEIALSHGQTLMANAKADEAAKVLAPFATNGSSELRQTYASALLAVGNLTEAEPVVWSLFLGDPSEPKLVGDLIGRYLDAGQGRRAADLARQLEAQLQKSGSGRDYLSLISDISDQHKPALEFLQYLAQVFDNASREHEYSTVLLKLFDLYITAGSYDKACECLDRATDLDAYEPGHELRLDKLRGKVDSNRFNAIAMRLGAIARADLTQEPSEPEPQKAATSDDSEPTVLEDLMLQAEIFLQYAMKPKALERLERIHKLFPHEEEKNDKLRELFTTAGFEPKYAAKAAAAPAPPARPPIVSAPQAPAEAQGATQKVIDNLAKVTEITRNITRQSSVKSVLFTTVNDVGRHWEVSRCVGGLCTPGKPPSAAIEYCAPGVKKSEVPALIKLIMTLQTLVVEKQGPVAIVNAVTAPELADARECVEALEIRSLMAVPLLEGDENAGIIILEQCGQPREWRNVDEVVLKTIGEQVVLAVNNARLRSLVKSLAVTDERSGLLKRTSYLDVLSSEVRRSLQQKTPLSVVLLNFGSASAMLKEFGEPAVQQFMQGMGQIVTSHIRQTDVAVRYSMATIALVLGDTAEKNAMLTVEKLRKVLSASKLPGKDEPVPVNAGVAEVYMRQPFDPADIVTEVINRVETALQLAESDGGNKTQSLAATTQTSAVGA